MDPRGVGTPLNIGHFLTPNYNSVNFEDTDILQQTMYKDQNNFIST